MVCIEDARRLCCHALSSVSRLRQLLGAAKLLPLVSPSVFHLHPSLCLKTRLSSAHYPPLYPPVSTNVNILHTSPLIFFIVSRQHNEKNLSTIGPAGSRCHSRRSPSARHSVSQSRNYKKPVLRTQNRSPIISLASSSPRTS